MLKARAARTHTAAEEDSPLLMGSVVWAGVPAGQEGRKEGAKGSSASRGGAARVVEGGREVEAVWDMGRRASAWVPATGEAPGHESSRAHVCHVVALAL